MYKKRRKKERGNYISCHIFIAAFKIFIVLRYSRLLRSVHAAVFVHPNSSPIERASALFVSLAAPSLRSIKPSKRGVCSRGRREVHAVIYHIGNNRNWQNTCFARAPQNQPKKRRKKQGKGRERERERERGRKRGGEGGDRSGWEDRVQIHNTARRRWAKRGKKKHSLLFSCWRRDERCSFFLHLSLPLFLLFIC